LNTNRARVAVLDDWQEIAESSAHSAALRARADVISLHLVLSAHLGYGTAAKVRDFYRQSVENVRAFLDGVPVRVLLPA